MRESMYKDTTSKGFEEWVKNSLAYEGYTEENEMFVRAVEIMKEQEDMIIMFKETLRMVRRSQNDVTSHLVGEKHV